MPSPEHEAVVSALSENRIADVPSIAEQRAAYEQMLGALPIPDDVQVSEVDIGHINADWVVVPESRRDRAVMYLHGGGYVIGSNVAYREFGGRLARATRSRVLLVNYRLAPEHPFPAALDDAVMSYRWLLETGVAPGQIVIAGDSAGGGLTLATLLALRDGGGGLPACAAVLSPWTDLTASGGSARPGAVDDPLVAGDAIGGMAQLYAGEDLSNPLASPLFADLSGLPPLLVQTGSREVLLDDSRRLVGKARDAGVEVDYFEGKGLIHVWPVLAPTAPESAEALGRIDAFMSRCLSG